MWSGFGDQGMIFGKHPTPEKGEAWRAVLEGMISRWERSRQKPAGESRREEFKETMPSVTRVTEKRPLDLRMRWSLGDLYKSSVSKVTGQDP